MTVVFTRKLVSAVGIRSAPLEPVCADTTAEYVVPDFGGR
jgi:hypothetical protein